MRRFGLVLGLLALAACEKDVPKPADTPPAAPAAAPINLASLAGMWTVKVMPATSDSVVTTYMLTATADTAGWTMTFPDRKPIPLHVSVSGDTVMITAPQYESVLRKGVMVTTNSVLHLVGDTLMGATTAHYNVKTADSVVALRGKGTKMPM